ncbi:MAG: ABC transporter permease [Anaerolineales bacterium]|nr:ABC transporter permease [Anaerolineales bacterium]
MRTAFRKVWRDLWNNKGRTLLVVLSIAVGVLAVGMITASNTLMTRQMSQSQAASHPSNVALSIGGLLDEATVKSLARLPGIDAAEGLTTFSLRWKPTLDAEWQPTTLIALADYEHQVFDLVELRTGRWPSSGSVAVEFNHVAPYHVPALGGTLYFEVNQRAKPFTVAGTVRDPQQAPPPFSEQPVFYVTRATLLQMGGPDGFNRLRFSIPVYTEAEAQRQADIVETRLNKLGYSVGTPVLQDPQRHFLQDLMDGVGLVLTVMAVLSLGLSTILVVNTINAVIAQQVPQIGIMKTIGGLSPQIASIYLAGVAVYGLLSLALAVPLGAFLANALAAWMLALINVPAAPFDLQRTALLFQLGAGLLTPLLAGSYPVWQGVSISVRAALNAYGLGSGHYGRRLIDRLLGRLAGLPRMVTLALRNTFRRLGRVALTQITLVIAGATFMMVLSTHHSFNETVLQIFRSFGYDVIIGLNQPQRPAEIEPLVEAQPGVTHAEMWVFWGATGRAPGAAGPGSEHDVALRGIPLNTELFRPELTAGRNLNPADGHALLLNQKLAREMGLGLGDTILLDFGAPGERAYTIVGLIFDLAGRDQNTAYLSREILNSDLNRSGRASVVEVRAVNNSLAGQQALERALRAVFERQGLGVSYSQTAAEIQATANAQFSILTTLLLIMTLLIAVVGSFGLSGTLSINVLERRREIGVMRAVGASNGDVGFIFMGEGLLLGVISWAQAVPISLFAGRYFVDAIGTVIDFPAQYHYSVLSVWLWLGVVVALSLLASWLPARRATQISVRESLAYE